MVHKTPILHTANWLKTMKFFLKPTYVNILLLKQTFVKDVTQLHKKYLIFSPIF